MRTIPTGAVSEADPPGCHCTPAPPPPPPPGTSAQRLRVALVGAPNVGKSALFNRLTGSYVAVSNYPGTTVEVARGHGTFADRPVEVVDTPGMYSLLATTEEERVAGRVVLDGEAGVLVHVVDAKNLPRLLPLTLQLIETGQPVVLALNMMDEAERLGWRVDADRLAARLGIAVAPIVAVEGRGIADLAAAVVRAADAPIPPPPPYGNGVGAAILALRETLRGDRRAAAAGGRGDGASRPRGGAGWRASCPRCGRPRTGRVRCARGLPGGRRAPGRRGVLPGRGDRGGHATGSVVRPRDPPRRGRGVDATVPGFRLPHRSRRVRDGRGIGGAGAGAAPLGYQPARGLDGSSCRN